MSHLESHNLGWFDDRMGDRPPAVSAPRIAQPSDRSEPTRFGFKSALPKAPRRSAYVTENANVYLWLGELAIQLLHRPRRDSLRRKRWRGLPGRGRQEHGND